MKTAYQYIRISDEDQSNFSLSGQEKMNLDYGAKHGISVVKTFIDDGYSAKDFNRPQWKALEKELSKNKTKIDYLIVTKYDRLIRNVTEGLAFIEKLEQKWDIKLLSVMENFFIDPHSPYFFKTRADLLVNAEFERRVISDRTKFGVWSAKSQGRFIGQAPLVRSSRYFLNADCACGVILKHFADYESAFLIYNNGALIFDGIKIVPVTKRCSGSPFSVLELVLDGAFDILTQGGDVAFCHNHGKIPADNIAAAGIFTNYHALTVEVDFDFLLIHQILQDDAFFETSLHSVHCIRHHRNSFTLGIHELQHRIKILALAFGR